MMRTLSSIPISDTSEAEELFIIFGVSAGLRVLVVCYAVMKDETDSRHNRPFFQKTRESQNG